MKKILLLIVFLISILTINAQYYADVQIFVENDGVVTIEGKSNHNSLLVNNSDTYTSKKGSVWTLNITVEENFDNFIYELNLPKYSQISYIKTTPTFRIVDEGDHIKLIGTGENRKFQILLQYKIDNTKAFVNESNPWLLNSLLFLVIIFLVIGSLVIWKLIRINKKKKKTTANKEENTKPKIDYSILPQRQQDIIQLLKKNDKMTQKQLEEIMEIPKSSVSRNVQTLVIKGIIEKEQVGQTNYLSLKN